MSCKADRTVRVGTGTYDWRFHANHVEELKITIAEMKMLASGTLESVVNWLSALPYPWCTVEQVMTSAADMQELETLLRRLRPISN